MAYYFFMGIPPVPLPVTPGALNIKTPSKNTTVTLINDGEINILKEQGLREISFDFLLPQQKYPFSNYSISNYTASTFVPVLNEWKKTKIPFQFIVTRMNPKGKILFYTNIKSQIEDFEYDEDAEAHGFDVLCRITLKEYKDYGTKSISLSSLAGIAATAAVAMVTKERNTASKQSVKFYIVKKGDTLWNICKKQLGNGSKYKEIADLNGLESPDKIYVGQKLRMS